MRTIEAKVKKGYRVASGTSTEDTRFNKAGGTIRMQIPEFKKRGLDFDAYFGGAPDEAYVCGTLGLDLSPHVVTIVNPEYHFVGIRWTDIFDKEGEPPFLENFFLSEAQIEFRGKIYKALLYIPDPATKPGHYHPPTTIEVVAQKIPNITYGDTVILHYNPNAIAPAPATK
ncbi:MAG: hypothetical protein PHW76_07005 [Alphaproteobacteria bacterium]|nr:hypothetical protein [Alphaproteobacteria bacterium]